MSIFDGLTFDFNKFAEMPRCYNAYGDNTSHNRGCTLTALWHGLGFKIERGGSVSLGPCTHPVTGKTVQPQEMLNETDGWAKALINEDDFCKTVGNNHDTHNERRSMSLVFKLLRAAKLYPIQNDGVKEETPAPTAPPGVLVNV